MKAQDPEIIPAILSKNIEDFNRDLEKLKNSRNLSSGWVHVDFMDNELVPNHSILPEDLQGINFGNLKKEAHLMVKKPALWIKKLLDPGFERIIIHLEADGDIGQYIKLIKDAGAEVAIALNHETDIEKIKPFVKIIDRILLMGVKPGFQGQPFIPECTDKVKKIKALNWGVKIEVDGAVKGWNAKSIIEAGADTLIIGSYLIQGNPDENLDNLRNEIT